VPNGERREHREWETDVGEMVDKDRDRLNNANGDFETRPNGSANDQILS